MLVVLAIGLRLGAGYLSGQRKNPGLENGVLSDCPDKPNCVASIASRDAQKVEPIAITGDSTDTLDTLVQVIESMSGGSIVQRDTHFIHATFTTRLLGFVDDVFFLYLPDQQAIAVKSQSRLGHSDLGANRKRVAEIKLRLGQH